MRIEITSIITAFDNARNIWFRITSSLPSPDNLQGIGVSVSDITKSVDEIAGLLRNAKTSNVDAIPWLQLKGGIESSVNALNELLTNHVGNPEHIASQTSSICSWLWSIKNSLLQLILPPESSRRTSPISFDELTSKIESANGWMKNAEDISNKIQQLEVSARSILSSIESSQNQSQSSIELVKSIIATIEGHEREAGTAKTNTESAAVAAKTEADNTAKLTQELKEAIEKKNSLFEDFESRRDQVNGLLENANKVGLAKSFQDKRKELKKTWQTWAILFIAGIAGLLYLGLYELLPLMSKGPIDPATLGVRLFLSSPIIWFTWFSARQYAHVLRICEDYSFKEASAMAFTGYRNEVQADPGLVKQLQESAIRNFSSNPADMLLKKTDAASPLHDVLEKALEKASPKEIMDLLTQLIKK